MSSSQIPPVEPPQATPPAAPTAPQAAPPSIFGPNAKTLLHQWSSSPYPAFGFSAALAAVPMIRPTVIEAASSFKKRPVFTVSPYPTNLSVLFFGGFVGLGGFLVFDHDVDNGSGLIATWSLLYALTNAKKSLRTFRLYPKALTVFALANSVVYGGRFVSLY